MGIRQNIEHTKTLLNQGIDLLLLRLQILNLDLAEQAENVFRIIIWLVVSGILLLIAFISLLFGLNRALSDTAAIWVFFGITALSLIVIAILFGKVSKDWRQPKQPNRGNLAGHPGRHRLPARPRYAGRRGR